VNTFWDSRQATLAGPKLTVLGLQTNKLSHASVHFVSNAVPRIRSILGVIPQVCAHPGPLVVLRDSGAIMYAQNALATVHDVPHGRSSATRGIACDGCVVGR
jgi:hypothetical protein